MIDRREWPSVARWGPVAAGAGLVCWVVVAVAGARPGLVVAGTLPALFGLRVVWLTARTVRDADAEESRLVAGWLAAGGGVMVLVGGWFALLVEVLAVSVTPGLAAATLVGAGALLGTRVGQYSVRARRKVAEATSERLGREYAERRQERIALLNRILRHHVRNGISVVLGYAEAAAEHTDPEGREHLAAIRERSREMNDTVDTFQRVAETLAGAHELSRRDLAADLAAAVDRARERYPGARFEVDPPAEDTAVWANDLLERVLYAQLENAVEHNDRETPVVEVTASRRDDRAVVSVADNGPGVPEEYRDVIFEAGDRGVTSEGDGLELFLADVLLRRYGGTIDVEDAEPRGAVFHTELRRADATPAPEGPPAGAPPGDPVEASQATGSTRG